MSLTTAVKETIVKKFKISVNDTGSSFIQIALLTESIIDLIKHLNIHKKDLHSKRGLIQKVSTRKKLLKYIKHKDNNGYMQLIKLLELRK